MQQAGRLQPGPGLLRIRHDQAEMAHARVPGGVVGQIAAGETTQFAQVHDEMLSRS